MSGLRAAADRLMSSPGTIAYLGNSVTVQKDGYRPSLHTGLCSRFGHPHREINAGFGAVGAIGSVCTMDEMVIRHQPDLCFIECMTGDMGVGLHANTGAAIEGILLKLNKIGCMPCFLNLPRRDVDFSDRNPVAKLYREIAKHHAVPAIEMGPRFAHLGDDFFRDTVHTTPNGGQRTAAAILEALEPILAAESRQLGRLLHSADFGGASVTEAELHMIAGRAGTAYFRLRYRYCIVEPGQTIRFASGDRALVGLLLIVGPDSGPATIAGKRHEMTDCWCEYERLHAHVLDREMPPGIPVEIAPLAPARLKLSGFLTRPA